MPEHSCFHAFGDEVVAARSLQVDRTLLLVKAYGGLAAIVRDSLRNKGLVVENLAVLGQLLKELLANLDAKFDHT